MVRAQTFRRYSVLQVMFAVLSLTLLQQVLVTQGSAVEAYLLPGKRVTTASSSSVGSLSTALKRAMTRKGASSSLTHAAAPVISKRRHGTGSLTSRATVSSAPFAAIKAGCGDGLVTGTELCDDKNLTAGDGCSATCTVETGFQCSTGQPSKCWSTCGDGVVAANERCDDGNTLSEDGCSSLCKDEFGFKCTGSPSVCAVPAFCGNGVVETGETCDDGNSRQFDGCYLCKAE